LHPSPPGWPKVSNPDQLFFLACAIMMSETSTSSRSIQVS
jgi:hypothetical protein